MEVKGSPKWVDLSDNSTRGYNDLKVSDSSAVHIVTERGNVYLMGRLTANESNRVTNLVSTGNVSGVQKVVKVFETITEEDLARLVAPSRP